MRATLLVVLAAALVAGACKSKPVEPKRDPEAAAPPVTADLRRKAGLPGAGEIEIDRTSDSRPLAWVNGDVVTYREVLLRIGPQIAVLADDKERRALEEQALLDIVEIKIIADAALDAGVFITREELDSEIADRAKDVEKTGGTLEAFLRERGITRWDFEERIKEEILTRKFMLAALGRSGDPSVRVRARADSFVSPQEVRRYYERNPERFHVPAVARMRMLTIRPDFGAPDRTAADKVALAKATSVKERLEAGEDFVPIFREYQGETDDPDPLDGLVEIHEGQTKYNEQFTDFAMNSEPGAVKIHQQGKGRTFYVMLAEGSQPARQRSYDEARAGIRQELGGVKRATAALEVELSVLAESSVEPPAVYHRLREQLVTNRRNLLQDYGL